MSKNEKSSEEDMKPQPEELHQFNFSIPSTSTNEIANNNDNNDSFFKISVANNGPKLQIKSITKLDSPNTTTNTPETNNNSLNNQDELIMPSDSKRQKTNESTINSLNKSNNITNINTASSTTTNTTTNNDNNESDIEDVDLSDVKLYKPLQKETLTTTNESSSSSSSNSTGSKRKRNESSATTEPTTSNNDINNNNQTNYTSNNNNNDNGDEENDKNTNKQIKREEVKTDPTKSDYWPQIYKTKYFRENSLNFKDILNREFGYSGRMGHGGPHNLFMTNSKEIVNNEFEEKCEAKEKINNMKPVLLYDQQLQSTRHFVNKAISGLSMLKKMKLSHQLEYHDGCVNALHFNRVGTLLASGSDDYHVCIWDYARSNLVLAFDSGHKSNVFQAKFMPFTGDSQIVTCARDGQVRLSLISSSGSHIGTKKLAKHADSCHKLSIENDSSNLFLSAGEDGVVFEIDLRQQSPAKILTVKNPNKNFKVPLYSISTNPFDTYQFIVAGKDQYVRMYDKRMLVNDSKVLSKFCPTKLKDSNRASITCAVFSNDGTEIIASYSDDDIFLFETNQPEDSDFKYNYKGHRNSETVKGVNFYGSNSDFIVSGSDCGQIFFWEKTTQQIVQLLKGNENGIVNVLEPNPYFPVLATSGLDSNIKIWSPLSEPNELDNLTDLVNDNQRYRDTHRHFSLSSFEFELLLLLMHRPNNRVFFRSTNGNLASAAGASSSNNENTNNSDLNNTSINGDELFRIGPRRRIFIGRSRNYHDDDHDDDDSTTSDENDDYYEFEHEEDDEDDDDEDEDNDSEDDDYVDGDDDDDDDNMNDITYDPNSPSYYDAETRNTNNNNENSNTTTTYNLNDDNNNENH